MVVSCPWSFHGIVIISLFNLNFTLTLPECYTFYKGRGCGTVKPFSRKYAAVRIAALQNFISSAVSVTTDFIG